MNQEKYNIIKKKFNENYNLLAEPETKLGDEISKRVFEGCDSFARAYPYSDMAWSLLLVSNDLQEHNPLFYHEEATLLSLLIDDIVYGYDLHLLTINKQMNFIREKLIELVDMLSPYEVLVICKRTTAHTYKNKNYMLSVFRDQDMLSFDKHYRYIVELVKMRILRLKNEQVYKQWLVRVKEIV